MNLPLISCLCVTRNKVSLIKRAIECFKMQTYPNKELILLYEDNDSDIKAFVGSLKDERIKVVEVPSLPKCSLGELRNISVKAARGTYFCQWDADDWYHNERLEVQMQYISTMHKPVCMFTYWIIFDEVTKKAFLSRKRLWEGSIMCKKSLVEDNTIQYALLPKEEDFHFVEQLMKHRVIYPVDLPHLYIYVYHGANTWDYQHFQGNFSAGKELSVAASAIINNILEGRYSNDKASEMLSSATILEEMDYKCEH
jgi:glycosyltransferase involved in cell wall biosynthesis